MISGLRVGELGNSGRVPFLRARRLKAGASLPLGSFAPKRREAASVVTLCPVVLVLVVEEASALKTFQQQASIVRLRSRSDDCIGFKDFGPTSIPPFGLRPHTLQSWGAEVRVCAESLGLHGHPNRFRRVPGRGRTDSTGGCRGLRCGIPQPEDERPKSRERCRRCNTASSFVLSCVHRIVMVMIVLAAALPNRARPRKQPCPPLEPHDRRYT